MAKVWNWNNRIKFDPTGVKRWTIKDPGERDYFSSGDSVVRLTQWQVEAIFEKMACVNVGYYPTHEEAVKAVDVLDAMKRGDLLDTDAEIIEEDST